MKIAGKILSYIFTFVLMLVIIVMLLLTIVSTTILSKEYTSKIRRNRVL